MEVSPASDVTRPFQILVRWEAVIPEHFFVEDAIKERIHKQR